MPNQPNDYTQINLNGLTDREKEITFYVAKGKMRKEIADVLCLADDTVKKHLQRIFQKTGVQSSVELAVRAVVSMENPKRILISSFFIAVLSMSSLFDMQQKDCRTARRSARKNHRTQITKQC